MERCDSQKEEHEQSDEGKEGSARDKNQAADYGRLSVPSWEFDFPKLLRICARKGHEFYYFEK